MTFCRQTYINIFAKIPFSWRSMGFLCIWILAIQAKGIAQELSAEAYVDSTQMLIGDHLFLNIELAHDQKTQVAWPNLLDTLGGFEILGKTDIDTVSDEGGMTQLQQLTLTAFDSGTYRIPPIVFAYGSPGDSLSERANTRSILIEVGTVAVDTTQAIKPIKDPLKAPITLKEVMPWVILTALLGLIAFGIYWFFFRKKPVQFIEAPKPPPVPAHELAMRKLAKLEADKLWQQGDVKPYYVALTGILREYLEGRYKVPALESTTDEIMSFMASKTLSEQNILKLKDLLQRADLAKFAKFKPEPKYHMEGMEFAREFVKSTKLNAPVSEVETQASKEVTTNQEGV